MNCKYCGNQMTFLFEAHRADKHYCDQCRAIAIEQTSTGDVRWWTFDSLERYVETPEGATP